MVELIAAAVYSRAQQDGLVIVDIQKLIRLFVSVIDGERELVEMVWGMAPSHGFIPVMNLDSVRFYGIGLSALPKARKLADPIPLESFVAHKIRRLQSVQKERSIHVCR